MYLTGSRSQFPNEIDTIVEMFNIPLSHKPYIKDYQELILKDNLTTSERERLNELTIRLEPYIFNVEKWNKFGDVLINMQKFFKEGVEPYIENEKKKVAQHSKEQIKNIDSKVEAVDKHMSKQVEYFDTEVGKLKTQGEWNPNTNYVAKNIVTHEGRGYIAIKDSRGEIPSVDSEYWSLIADKGEKGDPSLNIHFKGEYDSALFYSLGDAVTYNGLWYYAKKNTTGNNPVNKEYWELSPHSVIVSEEKPFDKRIPLWVDI